MIPKLVNELSADTMSVLLNAIAFDAKWADQYEDYQVKDGIFTAADGTAQDVEMMHGGGDEYYEFDNAVGFSKAYEGRKYRFVAILPDEDMTVSEWIAQMDSEAVLTELSEPERDYRLHGTRCNRLVCVARHFGYEPYADALDLIRAYVLFLLHTLFRRIDGVAETAQTVQLYTSSLCHKGAHHRSQFTKYSQRVSQRHRTAVAQSLTQLLRTHLLAHRNGLRVVKSALLLQSYLVKCHNLKSPFFF